MVIVAHNSIKNIPQDNHMAANSILVIYFFWNSHFFFFLLNQDEKFATWLEKNAAI